MSVPRKSRILVRSSGPGTVIEQNRSNRATLNASEVDPNRRNGHGEEGVHLRSGGSFAVT